MDLALSSGRHTALISKLNDGDVALDYKALLRAEKAAFAAQKLAEKEKSAASETAAVGDLSSRIDEPLPEDRKCDGAARTSSAHDIPPLGIDIKTFEDSSKYKVGSVPDLFYFPEVCSDAAISLIREAVLHSGADGSIAPAQAQEASLQNYKDYLRLKASTPDLWLQMHSRQLQCWGRQVDAERVARPDSDDGCEDEALPTYLADLGTKIAESITCHILQSDKTAAGDVIFDHVLINKYPSTGGILHHTDGPRYKPFVAILSLGGPAVMSFRAKLLPEEIGVKDCSDLFSVLLESNSLLVFTKDMYTRYLHGISPTTRAVDIIGEAGACLNLHLLSRNKCSMGDEICRGDRVSLTFRNVS